MNNRAKNGRAVSAAAALLVATAFASFGQTLSAIDGPALAPADDGYHFQYWEGSPYNAAYNEWWYFNIYDVKDDIQAIFTYQVADPLNLTGHGVSDLTAVVYQGKNIIPESDLYPLSAFTASSTAANVMLGGNMISVIGPNTYTVSGTTMDSRLGWSLTYDREIPSWFAGDRMQVASAAWQQMSWLLYMPRAHVTGTLTIDGQTYRIDCSGYHDHNWGQWDFETLIWNWAQYSQPGLSFDLGDFVGNPNGRAGINVGGQLLIFAADHYTLAHTKWAFDPQDNIRYPVQSLFAAQDGDLKLTILIDILKTEPLATGPPPSLVIYEQPAHFTGTLVQGQAPPVDFEGDGFAEYTAISRTGP